MSGFCLRHNRDKQLCPFFILAFVLSMTFVACQYREDQLKDKMDRQSGEVAALQQRVDSFSREFAAKEEAIDDLLESVKQERADTQVTIQDMRTEIQGLRGDIEELGHKLEVLKLDVQKIRADFQNNSLSRLEQGRSGADDVEFYNRTLKIILEEKDYTLGITKFQEFIRKYPQSTLADNAAYWIGEGYYAQGKFGEAILEFQRIMDDYPNSDKVCAALLKQALCFENLGQRDKAKVFFEETGARCQGKPEGRQAAQRLAELKKK